MKSWMKDKFRYLICDRKFYTTMYKLAIPIIIQSLIASSLNLVDTMMIGKLGESQIASVGIANQYFFLFNLIAMGVCSGCSVFISQFWGKKDRGSVRRVHGISISMVSLAALLFFVPAFMFPEYVVSIFNTSDVVISQGSVYLRIVSLSYIFTGITFAFSFSLRSMENAVPPMVVSSVALIANTMFNYALIFGNFGFEAMGVKGAAIATLCARTIECMAIVAYVYLKDEVLSAKLGEIFDFDFDFIKRVFGMIANVVLNEACWGFGFVAYSVVYGRIGTQAIAAVQICNTVQNIFMVVVFGMASASAVMVGNRVGSGDEEAARVYAHRFSFLGFVSGLLLSLGLMVFAPRIVGMFNVSSRVSSYCLVMLYITCAIMVVRVFNVVMIVGVLRGAGDAKNSLMIEGFTMWFVGVLSAVVGAFVLDLPVHYVYALVTLEEIVKFAMVMARFLSGKWIQNVVEDMGDKHVVNL